jgi:hypothetical protein
MTLLIAPYHLEVVAARDQFHRESYCDVLPFKHCPWHHSEWKWLCHVSNKTRRQTDDAAGIALLHCHGAAAWQRR